MRRHLFALILATAAMPAMAQSGLAGSGVEPSTIANSQARPIAFATRIADDGVLVILMRMVVVERRRRRAGEEHQVAGADDLDRRRIGHLVRLRRVGMNGFELEGGLRLGVDVHGVPP